MQFADPLIGSGAEGVAKGDQTALWETQRRPNGLEGGQAALREADWLKGAEGVPKEGLRALREDAKEFGRPNGGQVALIAWKVRM